MQTKDTKNSANLTVEDTPFVEEKIEQDANSAWKRKVDEFFQESKIRYYAYLRDKKIQKYAGSVIAFALLVGVLTQHNEDIYLSLFEFMGNLFTNWFK